MNLNLILTALTLIAATVASAATNLGNASVRIVLSEEETPSTRIAIQRLEEYGGFGADVQPRNAQAGAVRDITVLLGSAKGSTEMAKHWAGRVSVRADSYLVTTVSKTPLVIAASGVDERGTLYAAYHLADLLKAKADLADLNIVRQPKISERYAVFGATTYARKFYDPELHWRTLNEAPAFGYNGIVIYPNAGTPLGRRSSPVMETQSGDVYLDAANTARWRGWFRKLKEYQLDIMMTVPPAIPPGFAERRIKDYYAGGPEPEGYIPALQAHFRKLLELLVPTYPEVSRFMFNSTEGATYGRNERFFVHPDAKRFSNESYVRNNEKVMRAYMEVLKDFFGTDLNRVAFWTHSFGLTSEGIAAMRKVLFDYPQVLIIEDDFWNNNLWPYDLPAMAYLPSDLRKKISSNNPFALYQIATDGEYFGGGSLPNAYPGSHIRTAREAVERNARMVLHRLDLHDKTPYGTAFGPMKIVPYAASKQVWEPTPSEPEIWQEWAATRYGQEAAPHVIAALQESRTVLVDGLSCNGIDLLAVGSEFNPRLWMTDGGTRLTRFYLFGKPGRRFVDKREGDVIYSPEYTAWQMNTHSISISEFRENQRKALEAVRRGLEKIGDAKPHLTPADYDVLRGIFLEGDIVLKAVRLLGEAAYATNILLDNFDNVADPKASFEKAFAALEVYLDEEKLRPEMKRNIRRIIENYKVAVQ